jgi:ankyrin repeat protein
VNNFDEKASGIFEKFAGKLRKLDLRNATTLSAVAGVGVFMGGIAQEMRRAAHLMRAGGIAAADGYKDALQAAQMGLGDWLKAGVLGKLPSLGSDGDAQSRGFVMAAVDPGLTEISGMLAPDFVNIKQALQQTGVEIADKKVYLDAVKTASIAKILIDTGADVNKPLDAASFNLPKGTTPLHVAAWSGNVDLVKVLLDAGAQVNALDADGVSPVQLGAKSETVAKLLIAAGANPIEASASRRIDIEGAYPGAASRSSFAKMLIDAGADVNRPLRRAGVDLPAGTTALHLAAWGQDAELVGALVGAGAQVNVPDAGGRTPLHLLYADAKQWESDWSNSLRNEAGRIANTLVGAGANPAIADNDGVSSVKLIAEYGVPIELAQAARNLEKESSLNAANRFAATVGETTVLNDRNGRYAGPVLRETEHHVVQDLGRNTSVVHDKAAFNAADLKRSIESGGSLRVQYDNGRAAVDTGKGRAQGQTR